jgi:hypothetical protein
VDIWCPQTRLVESPFYAQRLKGGDTLWCYVCVSPFPPYANFFIDEPAIDHRVLFWQVRQVGATGLLYWSTTWWAGVSGPTQAQKTFPDIPFDISRHELYTKAKCHGDGFLFYPGKNMTPLPSIRLEVIRDGIEDYEYMVLLKQLVDQLKTLPVEKQPAPALMNRAQKLCRVPEKISKHMTQYTKNPQHILERRQRIADMIEKLSGILK